MNRFSDLVYDFFCTYGPVDYYGLTMPDRDKVLAMYLNENLSAVERMDLLCEGEYIDECPDLLLMIMGASRHSKQSICDKLVDVLIQNAQESYAGECAVDFSSAMSKFDADRLKSFRPSDRAVFTTEEC